MKTEPVAPAVFGVSANVKIEPTPAKASALSSEDEGGNRCCPTMNWGRIREVKPTPPRWLMALVMVGYFISFAVAMIAFVGEFINPPLIVSIGDFRPPLAVVLGIHGLIHYVVECLLAYAGVVVLYRWKPFHVLQHHLGAVILACAWNLMAVVDSAEYMHLMVSFRWMRLVVISCGITGINEGLWVLSNFAADPDTRAITGARVLCGMACLIQNIGVCIPCCALYVAQYLWPRFQSTGSSLALVQIIMNGVVQPVAFHLYLQGSFLRLQYKLLRRVWNNELKRPKVVSQV